VVIAAFNLTGPEAALDLPCYRGAELAAAKLNEAGGVLLRPLKLVPVDTESDPDSTKAKVTQALEAHPDAVAGIGFTDSTLALDAGRVFQKANIPFITPGATAPDLPETVGSDMFLAAYGDDAQAETMADYAWDTLKVRRVALWVDSSRLFTRTVGKFFDASFRKLGGSVAGQEFGAGVTDFGALIAA
jgi:branched-chain amino acid transport system substrate-binding protein